MTANDDRGELEQNILAAGHVPPAERNPLSSSWSEKKAAGRPTCLFWSEANDSGEPTPILKNSAGRYIADLL